MNGYAVRNQRIPSIQDEVIADIAEYAVMVGVSFAQAKIYAMKHFSRLLAHIHQKRGRAAA